MGRRTFCISVSLYCCSPASVHARSGRECGSGWRICPFLWDIISVLEAGWVWESEQPQPCWRYHDNSGWILLAHLGINGIRGEAYIQQGQIKDTVGKTAWMFKQPLNCSVLVLQDCHVMVMSSLQTCAGQYRYPMRWPYPYPCMANIVTVRT